MSSVESLSEWIHIVVVVRVFLELRFGPSRLWTERGPLTVDEELSLRLSVAAYAGVRVDMALARQAACD